MIAQDGSPGYARKEIQATQRYSSTDAQRGQNNAIPAAENCRCGKPVRQTRICAVIALRYNM
jgi:hypothetical protein